MIEITERPGQTSRSDAARAGAPSQPTFITVIDLLESLRNRLEDVHVLLSRRAKPQLTVEEVAELTGRSAYTVRRWISEGKLSAIRIGATGPRGRLLIPQSELRRLVTSARGGQIPHTAMEEP